MLQLLVLSLTLLAHNWQTIEKAYNCGKHLSWPQFNNTTKLSALSSSIIVKQSTEPSKLLEYVYSLRSSYWPDHKRLRTWLAFEEDYNRCQLLKREPLALWGLCSSASLSSDMSGKRAGLESEWGDKAAGPALNERAIEYLEGWSILRGIDCLVLGGKGGSPDDDVSFSCKKGSYMHAKFAVWKIVDSSSENNGLDRAQCL